MRASICTGLSMMFLTTAVHAVDQPLAGKALVLKRTASREMLKLVINDPALVVPVPGSADDPSATPGGFELLLFGHSTPGETQGFSAPPGAGWTVRVQAPYRYTYRNATAPAGPSPIRALSMRQGKGIKLVARRVGLALSAPQTAVGSLVRMGETQICALFDAPSVRRDEPGTFVAHNANRPGMASCSAEGLSGVPCAESGSGTCGGACPNADEVCASDLGVGCICISGSQPCGGTTPACNGECPDGQACADVGGVPYPSCACLPSGSTGCGTVGEMCSEGDCPAGFGCFTQTFTCCGGVTISGCGCSSGPPPPPCGGPCPPGSFCAGPVPGIPQGCYPTNCSGGGSCPPGSTCTSVGGGLYCAPIPCTGGSGYPACDGACDPGLTCHGHVQGSGACYCGP